MQPGSLHHLAYRAPLRAEVDRRHRERTEKVRIREYQDADYAECRALWVQLTERHRLIYGDPRIGGDDPGRGLDGYLSNRQRSATWVAEVDGAVVGMTGLIATGVEGEVEPVIVAKELRSGGIGRALVAHAVAEAKRTGVRYLSARPVARNIDAVRFFIDNGFGILGHVDLFQELHPGSGREWRSGISLHGCDLQY